MRNTHRQTKMKWLSAIAVLMLTAILLPVSTTSAAMMEFGIQITENDDDLQVGGTSIGIGDMLFYTLEWDTSATGTGSTPTGTADYETGAIQAGGSLFFGATNLATNNATNVVPAIKFEVKNSSAGSEDKWKTEAIFTDTAAPMAFGGTVSTSLYTPEKIKIELKSKTVNFLSTNVLAGATTDFAAAFATGSSLASLDADEKKFEIKWKGDNSGVKDPKLLGVITSMTFDGSGGGPGPDPDPDPDPGSIVSIVLNTDALGLGSTEINYDSNDSAVEADRPGQLVTSLDPGVGSVLTIQTNGLAGSGTVDNPLLVTVTARTYLDVVSGVPADSDLHAGVITLTNDGGDVEMEGLGLRAFGIDLQPGANFGKRYVNPSHITENTHGFQMEGSKEVSGGVGPNPTWAEFVADHDPVPSNNPPHVDEDVTFDINDDLAIAANSIKVLLTDVKAGSGPFDLAVNLVIELVGGGVIVRSYEYASDAPDVFTTPAGFSSGDPILQINFDAASLGLSDTDIIDSFTIGARDDPADDPKETDEHFLINGFSYNSTPVPEPATLALLVYGGLTMCYRRRKS